VSIDPAPSANVPLPAVRETRPWRLAVIGLVAVLAAAIGLAAGSFLATARLSGFGAGADYVPGTASMYVEVRLEPSAAQDAAVRDLLGRFPATDKVDLDRPLADQVAELLDGMLAKEELGLSWSEDIAPWTDGRLAFAVLDLPDASFEPAGRGVSATAEPAMLVLLGVTDPGAASATVASLLERADAPPMTTTEHRGVTIHAAADGEGAYAVTEDQLIGAPSASDVVAALDARAAGTGLAASDDLVAFLRELPDDWLAFGIIDLTDTMAAALERSDPALSSATMARILEHQPLRGAFAVTATDEGLSIRAVAAPPTGAFAAENAERGLAAAIPGDALSYAEGGNVGPALAEIIAGVKEAANAEPEAAEAIATAEAALGTDLEQLVAWIGDGALAMGWDGSEPWGGLVLVPSDRVAAERRLGQLATLARLATLDPDSGITVDEETLDGMTITTIRWEGRSAGLMPGAPTSMSVEYAFTDDHVLVGLGERFVREALALDPADSLAAAPRFADAVAPLGGPGAAGIAWMDLAGLVDAVREVAGPMLGAGEESAVLEWLRPFDRVVSVSRIEGGVLVQDTVVHIR
jgi:hypothetical protein